ncbi:hypothetical protein FHU10_5150 [Serratia fonticola]|uniref:Phage-related minor tail protein n=1 Tax=Serratia fonticola TaxID=47917 RepID=A0A559TD21_SERFO|nr:hypothetical protein [Serratia fonticola]TQI79999.1 hypothetical protein FHU09_2554 [Serratia fonticola]TQI97975.1 hypothetical protein FHU11_3492 [Serratia fonticola]TVZ72470.1 hypothetical protein FHU10_5150 [Serratia fonticola]
MNLLEAYYYTFAADASKLDKALSDSNKKVNELEDSLKKTDITAAKLGAAFIDLVKAGAKVLGIVPTYEGLKMLALDTAESTSALGRQAEQMNVNVSTLDAWRKAIVESGGDADVFTNTLGNLAQRFRDPEAALLRYSKALGGMNSIQAQNAGKMLGLDEGTIELLRKGRINVEELIKKQKDQGVVTKQQVEMADKFNHDLRVLSMTFDSLRSDIGTLLIPVMQLLLTQWVAIAKWARENKGPLGDVFMVAAAIVAAYYIPTMISAAAATFAATWPLLAIGAAIAALAVVIADVIGYFRGWDSVTGRLAQKFPALDKFLQASKAEVLALWEALLVLFTDPMQFLANLTAELQPLLDMFESLKAEGLRLLDLLLSLFTNPMQYLEILKAAVISLLDSLLWEGAGDTVFDFLGRAAESVMVIWNVLKSLIGGVIQAALLGFQKIGDAWKTVKGWFGMGKKEVDQASNAAKTSDDPQSENGLAQQRINALVYQAQNDIDAMNRSPITAMTSNSIANGNQTLASERTDIRIDNITVQTQAVDAQGIANGLSGALDDVYHHNNNGMGA